MFELIDLYKLLEKKRFTGEENMTFFCPVLKNIFRKESSMWISPTNACPSVILEGEDYGLETSINTDHQPPGIRAK